MAVDFESAFDTVSWTFLLEALDYYNFGFCWKHIIKTFYLNDHNFSRILLDGYLGPKINMNRGIRQGDPASGYLFNLVMEPLANQLIHSAHIKGIQLMPNFEVRVSQYADDLIVFSSPNEGSIKGVLHELKEFQKVGGLQVNVEKTKCLLVGRLVTMESFNSLGLTFVDELKILCIRFNRDNNQITSYNLAPLLPILTVEAAQWRRRNLSLMGKITVIKSLLLSKLVHILTALPNPSDEDIKKINNIFYKFIWNDGADKIKRARIVQDHHNDGLKMIDLRSFIKGLKISWLKRLYWANVDSPWAHLVKQNLPPVEEMVAFGSIKLKNIKSNVQNVFWQDVISSWADFCAIYKPDNFELLTDKLWYSDNTKFKKSIVREWNNKGLQFIADLFCKLMGALLSRNSLNEIFNLKMTFLCYSSLIRSIPPRLCNSSPKDVAYPVLPYKIALLGSKRDIAQIAYKHFIFDIKTKHGNGTRIVNTKME